MAAVGSGATGSTSAAAGVPSGVASGSLLVATVDGVWNTTTTPTSAAFSAPSGWTLAQINPYSYTATGNSFAVALYYKYATGADTGTYSFTGNSVGGASVLEVDAIAERIVNGPTSGNPFTGSLQTGIASSNDGGYNATSLTMPGVTVTSNSLLIGAIYASWNTAWSTPNGWIYNGAATNGSGTSVSLFSQGTLPGNVAPPTFTESGGGAVYLGIMGVIPAAKVTGGF